jgi:peptidylprolyl isomerase
MKRTIVLLFVAMIGLTSIGCAAKVEAMKVVQVRYQGSQTDGTVFDTTDGRAPVEVMIGGGFWIPSLEQALIGMKVGDKKRVAVPAAEAFGEYNPEATEKVPKDKFPDQVQFRKGMEVQTITSEGPTLAKIIEVGTETVTVDYNHPLAGKDLVFDVEIVKIRNPSREELARLKEEKEQPKDYFRFNENK